jgi:hypothetical protein
MGVPGTTLLRWGLLSSGATPFLNEPEALGLSGIGGTIDA